MELFGRKCFKKVIFVNVISDGKHDTCLVWFREKEFEKVFVTRKQRVFYVHLYYFDHGRFVAFQIKFLYCLPWP